MTKKFLITKFDLQSLYIYRYAIHQFVFKSQTLLQKKIQNLTIFKKFKQQCVTSTQKWPKNPTNFHVLYNKNLMKNQTNPNKSQTNHKQIQMKVTKIWNNFSILKWIPFMLTFICIFELKKGEFELKIFLKICKFIKFLLQSDLEMHGLEKKV